MFKSSQKALFAGIVIVAGTGVAQQAINPAILKSAENIVYGDYVITKTVPLPNPGDALRPIKNRETNSPFTFERKWNLVIYGGDSCPVCDLVLHNEVIQRMHFNIVHFSEDVARRNAKPYTQFIYTARGFKRYDLKQDLGIVSTPAFLIIRPDGRIAYFANSTSAAPITDVLGILGTNPSYISPQRNLQPADDVLAHLPSSTLKRSLNTFKGKTILMFGSEDCLNCKSAQSSAVNRLTGLRRKYPNVRFVNVFLDGTSPAPSGQSNPSIVVDSKNELTSYFQVTRFPQVVVLENGKFSGRIDYLKVLNGPASVTGSDAPFYRAIERAVQ
ncbi:hypothetical protein [Deinococcus sonorensis]|uniref:Thioredoxin domain-containing protein n=1 Tax=Deinococcus sonorensis TaxID=309891 RepID=A0ABV8YBW9_9DEIO